MVEGPERPSTRATEAHQSTSSFHYRNVSKYAYCSFNERIRPNSCSYTAGFSTTRICIPDSRSFQLSTNRGILPATLRESDGNAQPGDQPKSHIIWSTIQRIKTYGQHLARMVSVGSSFGPAEGTEPSSTALTRCFPGKLIVEEKGKVINLAKGEIADLILWCDGSKLDQGGAGAAVVWKEGELVRKWQEKKVSLGKNKEILDAEIWGISEALKV